MTKPTSQSFWEIRSVNQQAAKKPDIMIWHRHWKNVQVVNPAAHMGVGTANSLSSEDADLQIARMLQRFAEMLLAGQDGGQLEKNL